MEDPFDGSKWNGFSRSKIYFIIDIESRFPKYGNSFKIFNFLDYLLLRFIFVIELYKFEKFIIYNWWKYNDNILIVVFFNRFSNISFRVYNDIIIVKMKIYNLLFI